MVRLFIFVALIGLSSGCGKNDNFYNSPGYPLTYAPQPTAQNPYFPGNQPQYRPTGYPPTGYPAGNNGYYPPNGGFQPQLPPGMGNGYTPFLPVDHYMRQDPYRHQQWQQLWQGWLGYCEQTGISPYQFQTFWYDYCPAQFQYQMPGWYQNLNASYYGWMQPQMNIPQNLPAGQFWQHYQGYPMNW